jgi:peptide/nickel transport system permease protein
MFLRYLIRRLLFSVLTLWLITSVVFLLSRIAPSDPARAIAGPRATVDVLESIRTQLGLNDPIPVQYLAYMKDLFLEFDLGRSFINDTDVIVLIGDRMAATIWLVLGAAVIWLVVGIVAGVLSATRARSLLDRVTTFFVLTGVAMPTFLLGLLLSFAFLKFVTVGGEPVLEPGPFVPFSEDPEVFFKHLVLPWITLATVQAAVYTRLTRGSLLDVLGEDYIKTARAKGLRERRVIYRHGVRAALTPVITQFGVDIGTLFGGVVLTESVFGLQGIGQLAVRSLGIGDLPVIVGVATLAAVCIVVANLLVDIGYSFLDPRVRLA